MYMHTYRCTMDKNGYGRWQEKSVPLVVGCLPLSTLTLNRSKWVIVFLLPMPMPMHMHMHMHMPMQTEAGSRRVHQFVESLALSLITVDSCARGGAPWDEAALNLSAHPALACPPSHTHVHLKTAHTAAAAAHGAAAAHNAAAHAAAAGLDPDLLHGTTPAQLRSRRTPRPRALPPCWSSLSPQE